MPTDDSEITPRWWHRRHLFSGRAWFGLASGLWWASIGLFQFFPSGPLSPLPRPWGTIGEPTPAWWIVVGIGVVIGFAAWVRLAMDSANEAEKDHRADLVFEQNETLVREVGQLRNQVDHLKSVPSDMQTLISLVDTRTRLLVEARATVNQPMPIGISATGVTGTGELRPAPIMTGTGELQVTGHAPTVEIAAIDQTIKEVRRRLARNLGYALQYDDGTLEFPQEELPSQPEPPNTPDPNSEGPAST